MSMKRKAPCDINRDQVENNEFVDDEGDKPDLGKISTPAEIKERKILKIRGPKAGGESQENNNSKFQLNQSLKKVENDQEQEQKTYSFLGAGEDKQKEQQQASSLFDNSKVSKNDSKVVESKPVEISDSEKMKFSENIEKIATGQEKIVSSGLFNNKTVKQDEPAKEEKKEGGLFGNIQTSSNGGSLFGNIPQNGGLFTNNNDNKEKTGGLFGNAVANNNAATTGGLFGGPSLFSNTTKTSGNIFENNQNQQAGGLFANLAPSANGGSGLFGAAPSTGGGLFSGISNNQTTNNENNNQEDDDEDDDKQVSGQATPEIDASKTTEFKYEDIMDKLVDKPVNKFKKNIQDTQEKGMISVERVKGQENAQPVVVYRNTLKQILYQGNLVKKLSSFRNLNNKKENLLVQTIVSETNSEGVQKYTKDTLKIQFQSEEDGEQFKEQLIKYLGEQ